MGTTGTSSRRATPKRPRRKGRTSSPREVVPSGKPSTDTPAASARMAPRSARAPECGEPRSTKSTPSAAAPAPRIGQLRTSPLAITVHGASEASAGAST